VIATNSPLVRALTRDTPALPLGAGVSLKPEHYGAVLEARDRPAFFEIHAENYLCAGGPAHRYLERIRADSRLSIHGVGLSLGGPESPRPEQLAARRALIDRYKPDTFSEHLAWSQFGAEFYNDLLPFAYTREALDRVVSHVSQAQDALGRQILIENPATYLQFEASALSETGFLEELARRSGCGLLLDVNNIVVCATNHAFSPLDYLHDFPIHAVAQVHLAAHTTQTDAAGHALRIDTHDGPVQPETWSLYASTLELAGPLPTLIEWDSNLPDWNGLCGEAARAERYLRSAGVPCAATGL
jgi:uncharacterized protein (UPF0276 family)